MQKTIQIFTYLISILAVISCAISITHNEIYQDGAWANAQWLGQDIVSLLIGVPLLLISQFKTDRQNQKWKMVRSGALLYFSYTYAFYMFAAQLSFLYLFHLPIFGLAVIGFMISTLELFSEKWHLSSPKKLIGKLIITYLLLISVMLLFLWLNDIISHLSISGYQSDTPNGKAPLIIYSLDIALIIPIMLASAIGYWKKKQFGYLLTAIILTKTSTLGFALMGMSLSMYLQDLKPDLFLIVLWSIIGIIGSLLSFFYLRQLVIKHP